MVLYDTLLANGGDDETVFIAAHELGHRRENHVLKNVFVSSAGLLVGFGLLYLLTRRAGFLAWAGADAVFDLRVLPLLLLYMTVMTLVTLPVQNTVSRAFERRADEIAIELTQDPAPGVEAFRRLAFANIADLRPPSVAVWALYTHPPIPERIETLLQNE
jgi:STE24 endopeptidase